MKTRFGTLLVAITLSSAMSSCGSSLGSAAAPRAPSELPSVTFNGCVIPAGQQTWANILLTGGNGPFRAVWSIDGKVDSIDPQRTIPLPWNGTRLELLVTLNVLGRESR